MQMTRTLPDHRDAERHLGRRAAWLRVAILGAILAIPVMAPAGSGSPGRCR